MPTKEEQKIFNHRCKIYKKYYENWKQSPILCPYLKREVKATKSGWEHIAGMSKSRLDGDIHRRLELFKYARDIVKASGTCQGIRPGRAGDIYYTFEAVIVFNGEHRTGKKLRKIRVIVLKTGSGMCKFHSIMD